MSLSLLSSGNIKSSLHSKSDKLVQWCHGSPGILPLLVNFPDMYEPLTMCIENVWRRGMLKKGSGICHGIAGNAYSLLSVYIKNRDEKLFDKVIVFVLHILEAGASECCSQADRPFSLFEGLSGTIHFMLDVLYLLKTETIDSSFNLFDGLSIF